jgi:hypothetical protein
MYDRRFSVHIGRLYKRLGFKGNTIPKDANFTALTPLPIHSANDADAPGGEYEVKVVPNNGGYAKHRVFVTCKCGREIPYGRMAQHAPSCEALGQFLADMPTE